MCVHGSTVVRVHSDLAICQSNDEIRLSRRPEQASHCTVQGELGTDSLLLFPPGERGVEGSGKKIESEKEKESEQTDIL